MADAEETAREYVERYVRYGFYRPADVEEIVGDDVLGGELPRTRVRALVKAEVARQKAEQESWPEVTDCDRLDQAFAALRAEGILPVHNAGMTPSEGIAEMSEQYHAAGGKKSGIVGYCFYHRQDMEEALKYHRLGIAYGDIDGDDRRGEEVGQRVRGALEAAGLRVAWTGSIRDKLEITDFRWQRRTKARRTALMGS
ncbi:MAG: DUF6891 domain-containing protein [Lacipirellulaceae bacterium]